MFKSQQGGARLRRVSVDGTVAMGQLKQELRFAPANARMEARPTNPAEPGEGSIQCFRKRKHAHQNNILGAKQAQPTRMDGQFG